MTRASKGAYRRAGEELIEELGLLSNGDEGQERKGQGGTPVSTSGRAEGQMRREDGGRGELAQGGLAQDVQLF